MAELSTPEHWPTKDADGTVHCDCGDPDPHHTWPTQETEPE